jgi:outer membrane protein
MKNKFGWVMGAAALAALAAPAQAQEGQGKIQVKVLGTAVLPDGKITKVLNNGAGVPATTQTKANDNVVPTLAVEYFFSPNFSVETICCLTTHHVDATAGLPAGANLVRNINILPATVTLKAHMQLGPIKPYIGAGPTYFIFIKEKSGTAVAAALPKNKLNDKVGAVLQAGVDVPLGDKGFGLSLDAKRYFVTTTAHWYDAAGTEQLATRHKLDPWVLSAGVSYRF